MRTNRHRNAPDGAESPEKVPNGVRKAFSRRLLKAELRAIAEAVRRIGDPTLRYTPHQVLRFKERIVERLERLAGEVRG